MIGFRDNEVLWPTGYDVIVSPPSVGAPGDLYDGFWKGDHDFLIAFHNNYLVDMHCFRDNEVLLQARYDVMVNYPPGGAPGEFWKSELDFLIVIHSNFLSGMSGFRDNMVLLQPAMTSWWFIRQGALRNWERTNNCSFFLYELYLFIVINFQHNSARNVCFTTGTIVSQTGWCSIFPAIKGSPAWLSRVNGVRRSSAAAWNFNPSPKAQFYINWFQIWRGWLR